MCRKDNAIEQILAVFSDYLTVNKQIDIFFSHKFGYIMIDKWHIAGKPDYQIQEITTAEQLCRIFIGKIEQDYIVAAQIEDLEVPLACRASFIALLEPYFSQLPEYRYLLEDYRK